MRNSWEAGESTTERPTSSRPATGAGVRYSPAGQHGGVSSPDQATDLASGFALRTHLARRGRPSNGVTWPLPLPPGWTTSTRVLTPAASSSPDCAILRNRQMAGPSSARITPVKSQDSPDSVSGAQRCCAIRRWCAAAQAGQSAWNKPAPPALFRAFRSGRAGVFHQFSVPPP